METHIEGTMYGTSYIGYKVWRLIESVRKFKETLINGSMFGDSY